MLRKRSSSQNRNAMRAKMAVSGATGTGLQAKERALEDVLVDRSRIGCEESDFSSNDIIPIEHDENEGEQRNEGVGGRGKGEGEREEIKL